MLRSVLSNALRTAATVAQSRTNVYSQRFFCSNFGNVATTRQNFLPNIAYGRNILHQTNLLQTGVIAPVQQQQPTRNVTKFSLVKGKRKTVRAVVKRFKRLDWGIWIRTHSGRHKKLFKKSNALKRRLRQHVFTNATQSWLLDSMVTRYWRRPKYYIDDPYEPYHKRDEFFATKGKTFKV